MNIEIRKYLKLHLYGFSAPVHDRNFGKTGLALSGRMWDIVKVNKLPHKGINIWVYDSQSVMFAGAEIDPRPDNTFGMEQRDVHIETYAWYKHVGPYSLLGKANETMRDELRKRGLNYGPPSLEIYGHYVPDESKLETEIIYSIY